MSTVYFRFKIDLEDHNMNSPFRHHGPLFHRWLPNGEQNAIRLSATGDKKECKVWFERLGYTEDKLIRFSYKRYEVDPTVIPKQAILDAGPLNGLLRIPRVSKDTIDLIKEKPEENDTYISFVKQVVDWVYEPISKFIRILNTHYGQYWISNLDKWDSRKMSLGAYCSRIQLKWCLDDKTNWKDLGPDSRSFQASVAMTNMSSFFDYLTEEDWKHLPKINQIEHLPFLSAYLLSETSRLIDQDDLKHAFIEGVSALEAALDDYLRDRLSTSKSLQDVVKSLSNLPLSAQVVAVVGATAQFRTNDLEYTVEAINIRNKIIHEGYLPTEDKRKILVGLIRIASTLVPEPRFKFLSTNPGNAYASE